MTGIVHKYGDHIDTDVIIPARTLSDPNPESLSLHCMEDIDKEFVKRVKSGDIMVGGVNFGCGSSREHAPIAIKAVGISCVIAVNFARIFYRNAINIGLPVLECEEAAIEAESGDIMEVNLTDGIIINKTKNRQYQAVMFPPFMQNIINAGGLLNQIKKKRYKITILEGDGIGPEIMKQAVAVLDTVSDICGFELDKRYALIGGCAIDSTGTPLPEETIESCKSSDAVLLGAVGGDKWDNAAVRPEAGLLKIRSELNVYANLRPAIVYESLADASPLKREILDKGLDIMMIRELTGGIYFGKRGRDGDHAFDTEEYNVSEIKRIAEKAFVMAAKRNGKLCSVDKANVLATSKLWREIITETAKNYPGIELTHMYVDNAAMQLVRAPYQFDTIVTSNMFGDILSDEASQITGSIGMLPSASLGDGTFGLYEPIHGSAPDIAGKGIANPVAMILSAAMMLRYSFSETEAADLIEQAVANVLKRGVKTIDIAGNNESYVTTKEMGEEIVNEMKSDQK